MGRIENKIQNISKIIDYLKTNGYELKGITNKDLGKLIDMPKSTVAYMINALLGAGIIRQIVRKTDCGLKSVIVLEEEFREDSTWKDLIMTTSICKLVDGGRNKRVYGTTRIKIIDYLRLHGGRVETTCVKIARKLEVSYATALNNLRELINAGIVLTPNGPLQRGCPATLFVLADEHKQGNDWQKLIMHKARRPTKPKVVRAPNNFFALTLTGLSKDLEEKLEIYERLKQALLENKALSEENGELKRDNEQLRNRMEFLEDAVEQERMRVEEERKEVAALNKRINEVRAEISGPARKLRFDASGCYIGENEI